MSNLTPREEESFAKAASELYEDKREELVWAKAFVEAEGDEDKARTIYIKLRAGQLTDRAAKKAPVTKAPAPSPRPAANVDFTSKAPHLQTRHAFLIRSTEYLNFCTVYPFLGQQMCGGSTS